MAEALEFVFKPEELIIEADLKEALKSEKGSQCVYKSHKIIDTLNPERLKHRTRTLRIKVDYAISEDTFHTTYIVKLYSCPECLLGTIYAKLFEAEHNFYTVILPKLNEQLQSVGEPLLRTADYVYGIIKERSALIFFKDLSVYGYRTAKSIFDDYHARLVITELSRFHSAAMLLFACEGITCDNVAQKYPMLANTIPDIKKLLLENGIDIVQSSLETGYHICRGLRLTRWELAPFQTKKNLCVTWDNLIKPSEKFLCIRHGNLKNTNMLFRYRYQESIMPLEVSFIDFQMVGIGPQSLDLHHFMFPCLETDLRIKEANNLFNIFQRNCSHICAQGNLNIFTKDELVADYQSKRMFGFLITLCLVPYSMMRPGDHPDLTKLFDPAQRADELKIYRRKISESVRLNTLTYPRLKLMLDRLSSEKFFDGFYFAE